MDMFNLSAKLDSSENDGTLKRHIQEAFPCEPSPTPATTLLERILIKAEAMPQATPDSDAQSEAPEVSPSVAMQQHRASQQTNTLQRHTRQLRHLNWQLYHQYLERPLHKANVGSGIQF